MSKTLQSSSFVELMKHCQKMINVGFMTKQVWIPMSNSKLVQVGLIFLVALVASTLLGRPSGANSLAEVHNRLVEGHSKNKGRLDLKMYSRNLNHSSLWVVMLSKQEGKGQPVVLVGKLEEKMSM